MKILLDDLLSSPEFLPISIDLQRRLISFVRLSREDYRESSFLDYRAVITESKAIRVNLDDLLYVVRYTPSEYLLKRIHYIFHPAFGCSTLLTRYLDLAPSCFVLREPHVLTEIVSTRPTMISSVTGIPLEEIEKDWAWLLKLGVLFLNRRYSSDDVVIVKPNDRCNGVGYDLLSANQESRAIFLSIDLRTFLLAVLKAESRRIWLRRRLLDAVKEARRVKRFASLEASNLTDAQAGAYIWLVNSSLCRSLQDGAPDRMVLIDGNSVADTPEAALRSVTTFFDLPLDQSSIKAIVADASTRRYSKNLSIQYDAETRRRELAQIERDLRAEVQEGVCWCRQAGHEPGLDWSLGD